MTCNASPCVLLASYAFLTLWLLVLFCFFQGFFFCFGPVYFHSISGVNKRRKQWIYCFCPPFWKANIFPICIAFYLWHSQTLNGIEPQLLFLSFLFIIHSHYLSDGKSGMCLLESIRAIGRAIERWHSWTSDLQFKSLTITLQASLSRWAGSGFIKALQFRLAIQMVQMNTALIPSLHRIMLLNQVFWLCKDT